MYVRIIWSVDNTAYLAGSGIAGDVADLWDYLRFDFNW